MLNNITIKVRLVFVLVLLGAELVAGAAVGLVSLSKAGGEMHDMYANGIVSTGQLDQVARRIDENQILIAQALTADAAALPELLAEIDGNRVVVEQQWKAYSASDMDDAERAKAQRFAAARDRFLGEAIGPAVAALRAGDVAGAAAIVHGPMKALFGPTRDAMDVLIQQQLDDAARTDARSQSAYGVVRAVCLGGTAFGLAVAAGLGTLLVRGIVRPLDAAVRIAGAVADGDLTQEIAVVSGDETGRLMQALNEMNDGLIGIVSRVRTGTDTIANASADIAAGNLDLSSRTEQQAAALEETASSMDELTSTVKQNAEHARQASLLARSASAVADKGGVVVSEVVSTMGAIDGAARRIADIIGVIDGIAFQTNILALNAAVEAARAGEQGRGFAVVAGEVRSLAQRSAVAAREIKGLIDDSLERVTHGSALVARAGATMADIVQSIDRVTGITAHITSASQEQTAGIEEINRAIAQMDRTTQQNAALVEQASAAAQSLRDEADGLARAMKTFRLRTPAPARRALC